MPNTKRRSIFSYCTACLCEILIEDQLELTIIAQEGGQLPLLRCGETGCEKRAEALYWAARAKRLNRV